MQQLHSGPDNQNKGPRENGKQTLVGKNIKWQENKSKVWNENKLISWELSKQTISSPNMTAPKTVTSVSEMFDVFQMKLNLKTNKPSEDSALGLFQRHTCWTKSNPLQFHSVD